MKDLFIFVPENHRVFLNIKTGLREYASTAGKFASAFALGSQIFVNGILNSAKLLAEKSEAAFDFGLAHPGACQTAPCTAPYFYEEDNWTDDMELAAAVLFRTYRREKIPR